MLALPKHAAYAEPLVLCGGLHTKPVLCLKAFYQAPW